jgi:hypothetical protein
MLQEEEQRNSLFGIQQKTRGFQTRAALAPFRQPPAQPSEFGGTKDDPNSPFRGTRDDLNAPFRGTRPSEPAFDSAPLEKEVGRAGDNAARAAQSVGDAAVRAFDSLTRQLSEVDLRLRRVETR